MDTLAAIAAMAAGLRVQLVFPRGFRQEDGPLTPSRRRALAGATFRELASPEFEYRTWTCAYLADAVILLDPAGGAGCQETVRAASHLGRPLLALGADHYFFAPEITAARLTFAAELARWLDRAAPQVLMIAGCRASLLAAAQQAEPAAAALAEIAAVLAAR